MATKAFQRTYTQLQAITKATVTLNAKGVSNEELATVGGKLAQVVKTKGACFIGTKIRSSAGHLAGRIINNIPFGCYNNTQEIAFVSYCSARYTTSLRLLLHNTKTLC